MKHKILLAVATAIGIGYASPAIPQTTYEVGGVMPTIESLGKSLGVKGWTEKGKKGIFRGYDTNSDGRPEYVASWIECPLEGGIVEYKGPFGIYTFKTGVLLLDNGADIVLEDGLNNGVPMDGFIDEVVYDITGKKIGNDAPDC